MKNKILSKVFAQKNKRTHKSEYINFGDDVVIDLEDYYKVSFVLRKRLEFKKKDFGRRIILEYYSNTIDPENSHIVFNYTTKKKPKSRFVQHDFLFTNGHHFLEFKVPVDLVQLNSIEIYITKEDNVDGRYILRFEDIYFEN